MKKKDFNPFEGVSISTKRAVEAEKKAARERHPPCQWRGCDKPGPHKAPKGRGKEGQFYNFCVTHVQAYNKSYNYFDGMNDVEVEDYHKNSLTGHRPTWKMGAGSGASREGFERPNAANSKPPEDPHEFLAWREERAKVRDAAYGRRHVRPLEKKALDALGLPDSASKADIKSKFKDLVKIHHPDANGGDTRSEEKLRDIIQAYNHLKAAGLV